MICRNKVESFNLYNARKIALQTHKMNEIKYVGVQSWKDTHLPTLDIRVEQ